MAKICEELVVLKLSKLVRENTEDEVLATDEVKEAIENLLADQLDASVVVEIVDLSALGL